MSLVTFGTTTTDPENVEYPDGGAFLGHFDAAALGSVTLTVEVYTQAHQGSAEVLHSTWTIVGPTPTDPDTLLVGKDSVGNPVPIVTSQPVRFVVSGLDGIPYRIESLGQVSTVENGEGTLTADGTEQTLVEVDYPGKFHLNVDVTAMQSGDKLKLRLKSKDGGSYETVVYKLVEDAPADKVARLYISVPEGCLATLRQTAGTNRSYPWSLLELGR